MIHITVFLYQELVDSLLHGLVDRSAPLFLRSASC